MMGHAVEANNERKLVFFELEQDKPSASTYARGQETRLRVALLPTVRQFALEVKCGSCWWEDGKCAGQRRSARVNATLVIPADHRGAVEVRALWGETYGAVQLAPPIRLLESGSDDDL